MIIILNQIIYKQVFYNIANNLFHDHIPKNKYLFLILKHVYIQV